jgi:UDP-N-acetylglucosamine 1-carboxyvinyltransferase
MDRILIRGGNRLSGKIAISGAKNAALTLMPCALLTDEPLTLRNLPRLADVDSFGHLLNELGASTAIEGTRPTDFGRVMTIRAGRLTSTVAPYDIVRKMRASILVLGPAARPRGRGDGVAARRLRDRQPPDRPAPEGARGDRRRDRSHRGLCEGSAPGGRLKGGGSLPGRVGRRDRECADGGGDRQGWHYARECGARARDRRSVQLLVAMGAHINGIGTETLEIEGRDRLHGATYAVMPDRIEAGSYACAAAITGGDVELVGAEANDMRATLDALIEAGVTVEEKKERHPHRRADGKLKPLTLSTAPFPGFATDMQAQFMAMLCKAEGASVLTETIFENRYMHVPELARMGATSRCAAAPPWCAGRQAGRRAGDGDRPARIDEPDPCRPGRRGRDAGQSRLSPRPRL